MLKFIFKTLRRCFSTRVYRILAIACVFILPLLSTIKNPIFSSDAPVIGNCAIIIRSQQIPAYNETIRGFETECKRENISVKAIYDLKGDIEVGKKVIQGIVKDGTSQPNLILAVGILAATLTKERFPGVPIIFCMVINHERFDLRGENITGISSEAPVEDQFAILKGLLGARKNIGVIYDPGKTGRIVSESTSVADKYGLRLTKTEVTLEREVAPAIKNISSKIDALWLVPDSTVITKDSLDVILKTALKNRLPVFCTSSAIVKAGALLSVSPDYENTGYQAAQIAKRLLQSPTPISLGVQEPEKLKLTINTRTAEIIGMDITALKSRPDVVLYP